jgi:hypothetical protein
MKKQAQFQTQKEFLRYLVDNKKELINFKRAAIKHADAAVSDTTVSKALTTSYDDDLKSGIIKRTVIGNTYNCTITNTRSRRRSASPFLFTKSK